MRSSQAKSIAKVAARLERRATDSHYIPNTFEIAESLLEQPDDELALRENFLKFSKGIITTPGAALRIILVK